MGRWSSRKLGPDRRERGCVAEWASLLPFCRRRTISWDVPSRCRDLCWPIRPTGRHARRRRPRAGAVRASERAEVREREIDEIADMRGAADVALAPPALAVPALALPSRPALARARSPAQALVRVRAGALGGGASGLSAPAPRRLATRMVGGRSWGRRRDGAASRIEPCPQPMQPGSSASRSTRSAAWPWTWCRRPTRGIRAPRWRLRRWPTRCSSASCGRTRATRAGPTATASCSAPGTRACCSTRCCTSPAMTWASRI